MKTKNYALKNFAWIKLFSFLLILLWQSPLLLVAQQDIRTVDMKHINELKIQNKLTGNEHFVHYEAKEKNPLHITNPVNRVATAGNCNCWIDRDSTWTVVPFDVNGSGGSGGAGVPPDYRVDDWSTDTIVLPFSFCFYNNSVNNVFINSNGNISIDVPYSTYTATPFPNTLYEMIAPLWSDVDTRDLASGVMYYKLTSQYLIVQWDGVGYFNSHSDKLNTYQLIISDGSNEIIPRANNVSFCYKDMQWSTGDASGGTGGFGGTPATAGVNKGDGVHYLQLGLFDQAGTAYDGPFGNNDGIDALDNQYFYFKVCDSVANIAPIIHASQICDSVTIFVGDSTFLDADYLSPELGQITTVSYITTAPSGVSLVSSTNGNVANINVRFLGQVANLGYNTVQLTGTDNGTPPKTSTNNFVVNVIPVPVGLNENTTMGEFSVYPNPADGSIHVLFTNYDWKNASLMLTDQLGKKVFEKEINENLSGKEVIISSAKLSKGFYLLTVKNEKESVVKRIEVIHQ